MNITRRTALTTTGFTALAALLAACGSNESSQQTATGTSASADTSASAVSEVKPAGRNDNGYQVNSLVDGGKVATLFTDYQCPYCAKVEDAFHDAARQLDGVMNVTVKNFPLPMHANAVPAALAVMAAEQQGKHVEFGAKLFTTQNDWKGITDSQKLTDTYKGYAQELGLDVDQFTSDLDNEDLRTIVEDEYKQAMQLEMGGTPTFLVDGKKAERLSSASSADEIVSTFKDLAGI